MGMEKGIKYGKEYRKPYRGEKAIDKACRNHGDDPWSKGNRLFSARKRSLKEEWDEEDLDTEYPRDKEWEYDE